MGEANAPLSTFNRGIIDLRALARTDIKRIALAAEKQTNWMPRTLGSMTLRPGLEKVAESHNSKRAKHVPFVFATDDTDTLEVSGGIFRVLNDGEHLVTRPLNNTAIANGTFETNLTSWTDSDESGATSAQKTVDGDGVMSLIGTRFNAAIRDQEVYVFDGQSSPSKVVSTESKVYGRKSYITGGQKMYVQPGPRSGIHQHAIRVVVQRGPVQMSIGSELGGQQYISLSTLDTGVHSIAFTPRGNFFVRFLNRDEIDATISDVSIEGAGPMTIPVPYREEDLDKLRWGQSGSVVYLACDGYPQYRVQRRGSKSWSVVKYLTTDGPFRVINVSSTTLTSSALSGESTITASQNLFNSGHIGSLWRLRSVGQNVSASITAAGEWTDAIRVIGVGDSRKFTYTTTDTWVATVTLQRSIDDEGSWTDVLTFSTNQAAVMHDDGLDDTIAFYRIGVDTGDFTSGTIAASMAYGGGSLTGVVRMHTFTSPTVMVGSIVKRMGATTATPDWYEGVWSDSRGWPTSVTLYEGRLWWFGRDWILGSVSDAFRSFDDEITGKSAPLIRTLGQGPVDIINWGIGLQRLILGTQGGEISIRASAFDEPISVDEFNLKEASTLGTGAVKSVKVDSRGLFIDRSLFRLYEMEYSFDNNDYGATDLSLLAPDIGSPGFIHIEVQRKPDTRIHCIKEDGTVAVLVYDPAEEVRAWIPIETGEADGIDGVITDCVTFPDKEEDKVYYQVRRIVDGKPRHFLERWAKESECIGGTITKLADCFKKFSYDRPRSVIDKLEHLIGKTVIIWADGKCLDDSSGDIATFTVSATGTVTPTDGGSATTVTQGVVGLQYTSTFKSAELPYAASLGTTLTLRQQIERIGLLLLNTHHKGLLFGRSETDTDTLPEVIDSATVADDTIHSYLSEPEITFPGALSTDTRLFLLGKAPRPVTVLASVLHMDTSEVP
tara:strand:+ start:6 stop:2846 length:2841 start_codon:yes stop_codon:yes gene_type:complete